MKQIRMFLLAAIVMLTAATASMGNTVPVANAGAIVTLNSSDSYDADGDRLNFRWELIVAPEGSTAILAKTTGKSSKFQTDVDGLYVVELIANDGFIDSDPDTITVRVGEAPPSPVVDADTSTVTASPASVIADGTATSTVTVTAKDADSNPITDATVSLVQTGSSTINDVTDNEDGTYTFTVSSTTVETVTYTVVADGIVVTQTASVSFITIVPDNLTINNAALEKVIVSTFDDTPYNPAIDIEGVIDAGGLTVSVPYTVVNESVTLPAYSTSVILDASVTEDGEEGIVATFAWVEQPNLLVGSGFFTATININDNGIYYAKKLDTEDSSTGLLAATFPYETDNAGGTGALSLKIMPGIPDRMYGVADNTGDTTTHDFLYLSIINTTTGITWLSNNLGANYANMNSAAFNPLQQATASDDHNAYGSLFQWGRKADGHELISWTSGSEGIGVNGITDVNSDNPTHALFITEQSYPYDWRVTWDDTLWAQEYSPNNVCPVGYTVPYSLELDEERQSWRSNNAAGALVGDLSLSMPGRRDNYSSFRGTGVQGYYWGSGSPISPLPLPYSLSFGDGNAGMVDSDRAYGCTVRCLKDY